MGSTRLILLKHYDTRVWIEIFLDALITGFTSIYTSSKSSVLFSVRLSFPFFFSLERFLVLMLKPGSSLLVRNSLILRWINQFINVCVCVRICNADVCVHVKLLYSHLFLHMRTCWIPLYECVCMCVCVFAVFCACLF